MKSSPNRLALAGRRGLVLGAAAALLTGIVATPAAQADESLAGTIDDASFVWGISGYAQVGVFGPWVFKSPTGDAQLLSGGVSGGTQTEYVPAAFPATSFPANLVTQGKTPNAVKYTGGEGTRDADGNVTIDWDGDFTFNGYPASFNAPDEKLSDPSLTVNADGSGALSFDVIIAAGVDIDGNPTEETNAGRTTTLTFGAGAADVAQDGTITLDPDYANVTYAAGAQDTSCTGDNVWGAWPVEFIDAVADSVRPHYYNTGCGGTQNTKGPLPVQLNYTVDEEETQAPIGTPTIEVSETTFSAEGEHQVTVTGSGFNNPAVVGTRPPLAGMGTGAYVVFGKFLDEWKPSAGAASGAREVVDQRWALPTASFDQQGGELPYIEIDADGNFTATLTVSKDAADTAAATGNYGIYTYAGGGVVEASYETYTQISFTPADNGGGGDDGTGDIDDPDTGNGAVGSLGSLTRILGF